MSRGYPLGIVGESHYQRAIRRCQPGDAVRICHEIGNPHDARALVVKTDDGETIGYVPRDNWVRRAVFEDGHCIAAAILEVATAGNGLLAIVLEVHTIGGEEIEAVAYAPMQDQAAAGCAAVVTLLILLPAFASLLI